MAVCDQCGKETAPEESSAHLVRKGYSPEHFPLLKYEKSFLCPGCLSRQRKVELFEKAAAILTLGVVLFLMIAGILFLFGLQLF